MAKDRLNRFLRYAKAIQVRPQSSPCSVPAVPLGKDLVTFKFVVWCDPFFPLPTQALRHSSFGFPHTAQRLSAGRMARFRRFPKSIG